MGVSFRSFNGGLGSLGVASRDEAKKLQDALNDLARALRAKLGDKALQYAVAARAGTSEPTTGSLEGEEGLLTFYALRRVMKALITGDLPNVPGLQQLEVIRDTLFNLPIIDQVTESLITGESFASLGPIDIKTDAVWALVWTSDSLDVFKEYPTPLNLLAKLSGGKRLMQDAMGALASTGLATLLSEVIKLYTTGKILWDLTKGKAISVSGIPGSAPASSTTPSATTATTFTPSSTALIRTRIAEIQARLTAEEAAKNKKRMLLIGGGVVAGVLLARL